MYTFINPTYGQLGKFLLEREAIAIAGVINPALTPRDIFNLLKKYSSSEIVTLNWFVNCEQVAKGDIYPYAGANPALIPADQLFTWRCNMVLDGFDLAYLIWERQVQINAAMV